MPHPRKTKIMLFSKQSQAVPLDDHIPLNPAGVPIDYTSSYKCLGFTLDDHLEYKLHLKDICKKVNYGLFQGRIQTDATDANASVSPT